MVFVACGLNHQTAPLIVREQIALLGQEDRLLQSLIEQPIIQEVVVLSTCNRTEIYGDTSHPTQVLQHLASLQNVSPTTFESYCYLYPDQAGIKHTLRVASGLDSMMLGEPQILGQMKQAYQMATYH